MKMSRDGKLPVVDEHPKLYREATAIIDDLRSLESALCSPGDTAAWAQHGEFARRSADLADHLTAAIDLAANADFASAFAVVRTALEHSCLDELLLLARRYREIVEADEATYQRLKAEFESGKPDWAASVISFDRTRRGVALVRTGHQLQDRAGVIVAVLPGHPSS
jgi:hypothetical protein